MQALSDPSLTKLVRIFDIYDNGDEALKSFK